jgi:hypothetical protein
MTLRCKKKVYDELSKEDGVGKQKVEEKQDDERKNSTCGLFTWLGHHQL